MTRYNIQNTNQYAIRRTKYKPPVYSGMVISVMAALGLASISRGKGREAKVGNLDPNARVGCAFLRERSNLYIISI